jgi:hypothetical protein
MEPVLGEPRDLGGGEGSEARHHRSQLPHGVARHALTRRGCITNVSCATCLVSEHAGKAECGMCTLFSMWWAIREGMTSA